MATVRILTEAELRAAVALDLAAVDCIEAHHGEVDVKTAYVPGFASFAIKISPGFFDNPKIGLPSTSGLMVLFAANTGQLEALLLDNGYLTDVRTAAAGAVAARHLARPDAESAAILGTGMQARLQLQALTLVRPIRRAVIWGRDPAKAEAVAAELTEALNIPVTSEADAAAAVAAAEIVVTTTPATAPILKGEWLRPGQHVTAMGSDQAGKNELDPACLARADRYVADRVGQTRLLGELRAAIEAGVMADGPHPELGDVVAGKAPGRRGAQEITIADLTGTGVQDTAIATLARQRADASGTGTDFNT